MVDSFIATLAQHGQRDQFVGLHATQIVRVEVLRRSQAWPALAEPRDASSPRVRRFVVVARGAGEPVAVTHGPRG